MPDTGVENWYIKRRRIIRGKCLGFTGILLMRGRISFFDHTSRSRSTPLRTGQLKHEWITSSPRHSGTDALRFTELFGMEKQNPSDFLNEAGVAEKCRGSTADFPEEQQGKKNIIRELICRF